MGACTTRAGVMLVTGGAAVSAGVLAVGQLVGALRRYGRYAVRVPHWLGRARRTRANANHTPRRITLALVVALFCASCGNGDGATDASDGSSQRPSTTPTAPEPVELWPAPGTPMRLARQAGFEPDVIEHLAFHAHAHLDVFLDGRPVVVPGGIGIAITDPAVKQFSGPLGTGFGGIEPPGCAQACISPLHTHDPDGILHTESPIEESNSLGQFFTEWGVVLSGGCVGEYCAPDTTIEVYVDGEPYAGDPATIALVDQREIAIVIGTPPAEIPSTADFSRV